MARRRRRVWIWRGYRARCEPAGGPRFRVLEEDRGEERGFRRWPSARRCVSPWFRRQERRRGESAVVLSRWLGRELRPWRTYSCGLSPCGAHLDISHRRKRSQHTQGSGTGSRMRQMSPGEDALSIRSCSVRRSRRRSWPRLRRRAIALREFALARVFAEFGVEKGVVEAGTCRIGGAGSEINGVEARPVGGSETHGTRLATGVKLAAGEGESPERPGCGADGVDLSMSGGIVGGGDGVRAFADDSAVAHDDRGERAATSVERRSVWPARWRAAGTPDWVGRACRKVPVPEEWRRQIQYGTW